MGHAPANSGCEYQKRVWTTIVHERAEDRAYGLRIGETRPEGHARTLDKQCAEQCEQVIEGWRVGHIKA